MLEDESLLTRLQTHDEQALEYLIEQYGGFVLATIRAVGRGVLNSADVEEIAAQTFLKLWGAAAKIDLKKGTIKSYLGAVARNTAQSGTQFEAVFSRGGRLPFCGRSTTLP